MRNHALSIALGALCLLPACTVKQAAVEPHTLSIKLAGGDVGQIYQKGSRKIKRSFHGVYGVLPNGNSFFDAKLTTRGNSDAEDPDRKSFNLGFGAPLVVFSGDSAIDKIAVLGLAEDRFLYRDLAGYLLFASFKLFFSKFEMAKLLVNDAPRGVGLIVEPPERALLRQFSDVDGVIRLNYFNLGFVKSSSLRLSEADLRAAYEQIQSVVQNHEGSSLYSKLRLLMDIDQYLRLLAINRVVRNGDYTDEILFGATKTKTGVYFGRLSQWDFEDLFEDKPHHNHKIVYEGGVTSLIFTGESRLDLAIAGDCELYSRYLTTLEEVRKQFDGAFLVKLKHDVLESLSSVATPDTLGYYQLSEGTIKDKLSSEIDQLGSEAKRIGEMLPSQIKMTQKRCLSGGTRR